MSSTSRFPLLLVVRVRQFHRICQLGFPPPVYGWHALIPRKPSKVSSNTIMTSIMCELYLICCMFLRYGVRVDPVQWVTVLTGEGGPDNATILMILCKHYERIFIDIFQNFWNYRWIHYFCFFPRFICTCCNLPGHWKGTSCCKYYLGTNLIYYQFSGDYYMYLFCRVSYKMDMAWQPILQTYLSIFSYQLF